jgi:hypothetical protein
MMVALLPMFLLPAACGGDDDGGSPVDGGQASSSPSTSSTSPGGGGGGGGSPAITDAPTSTPWRSDPVTVRRDIPVPPVPVLVNIRSAAHPAGGYDRIVFDFQGRLPGYDIRYVSRVIADGSGEPVSVPGRRFLQIRFTPAQAHTDAGEATVTQRSRTLDYPMMRAYAIVGDYEAVLTVAVGLDDVVGFRVGELPGRIYIDVAA